MTTTKKEELLELHRSDTKAILSELDDIRESIIRTKQRAITNVHLEHRIWDIWAYVRENQNSLDSGSACKLIRKIVEEAIADVQKRVEDLAAELERERKKTKETAKVETFKADKAKH
jgi:sulfur relay (sulfurtransferase) DsrC/TusE family protein